MRLVKHTPVLAFFFLTPACFGAVNHIQQAYSSVMTSSLRSSSTVSFSSSTVTGNAIIVSLSWGAADSQITASDSQGNTFSNAVQRFDSATPDLQGCAILYAMNIKGGADTITVKFSPQVAWVTVAVHEYSGLAGGLDVTAGSLGSGTSPSSTSAITASNGDLIFGNVTEDINGKNDIYTAGSGFTKRIDLGASAGFADEDQVQSSAGSVAANWTLSPSGLKWVAVMAAFKALTVTGPHITSLNPTSGPVGTSVTITGTGFGGTQGTSTVAFNGTISGVLASDNFNRVNANPIGTPWTAATGSIQLLSNAIVPASITPQFNSILFSGTWPNDQSVQATLTQLRQKSGYPALVLRSDSNAQNFYYIDLDASPGFGGIGLSTPFNLQKMLGGVLQPVEYYGFGYITPQLNDTFRAQIVGATISVFQNGTLIGSFTDTKSPIASGSPGLFLQPDSSIGSVTDMSWDNFVAGTAGTTSWSDTSIVTTVPVGATTGNVVVTVGGVQSNGVPFTVTSAAPNISSLSPSSGPVGTAVTITGTNFGATQGSNKVTFNGTTVTPTSWSATNIVAPALSGGNVVVTVYGVASNGAAFTVTSTPSLASVSPPSGGAGTQVTITGSGFGTSQGIGLAYLGTSPSSIVSWSDTQIVAIVATGSTTGVARISQGGAWSNTVAFSVPPTCP